MQLELDKEELERLLELAYLGEWMLNGHHGPKDRSKEHDVVLQKLYAAAEEGGLGYLIMTDEETGELKPSPAADARMDAAEFIPHYDDHVFWDELALRLAERDLEEEVGAAVFKAMTPAERDEKVDEIAAAYDKEFDKHDVDHLRVEGGLKKGKGKRDKLSDRIRKLFEE